MNNRVMALLLGIVLGIFIVNDLYRAYHPSYKRVVVDKITYLVVSTSKGIAVTNYTADSMEYEFLHPPTKTMTNARVKCDTCSIFYNDSGIIEIR